ncbi:MAG: response regulator [Vicinamibacterales bacterium]
MAHKLLLADDSVTIQRVIELTFADEDVEVTAVGDGQQAIDRLENDPPDIILADVDMPKRDGYEVAAYVKSRPKLAHIPVVLLTGAFEPIDQARAMAAGSSDVLAKPFEPQMVISRVKELLGRKRTDGEGTYASREAAPSHKTEPQMGDPQPAGEGAQSVSLDDYFDQLDAAFSNLQPGAPPSDGSDEVDWPVETLDLGTTALDARAVENAANFAVDAGTVGKPHASTFAATAATADKPVATAPARPAVNPFANLSAAKAEAAARPVAPVISDDVIEEIVSRVLQRMSDRVVRETVTDVVSQTAERLVQEEIERIRTES